MPQPLAHAQTRRNHSQAALYKRPLGEILVRTGRLTPSSLDFALDLQSETGGRLGDILVAHHFTSAEAICDALSSQPAGNYAPVGQKYDDLGQSGSNNSSAGNAFSP